MGAERVRAQAYRILTSAPLRSASLAGLIAVWKVVGEKLPREWTEGIDMFFAREFIGNVSADGDGPADSFRIGFVNAWFDQRITGARLAIDGRTIAAGDLQLRSSEGRQRADEFTTFEFPPGEVVELLALGTVLGDGLHLLEMTIDMELAPMIIPIVPIEMRDGAGDFPILEDRFRPPPQWPPVGLAPGEVHVVPHIHYDVEWLQTRGAFERVGESNLREMLRLMDADPEMTFATDQVPQLESFKRRDPAGFERLAALVREGRIEPVNGLYCEPDTNLLCGESLVRQSVAWQRFCLDNFSVMSTCGWLIDSFGMSAQLPQILQASGTSSLFFSRARPAGDGPSEFVWEGLDRTRILAHWMPLMYNVGHPVRTERRAAMAKMLKNYLQLRARSATEHVFYPSGIDHGRPQKEYGEMARAWNDDVDGVKFSFSLPSRFADAVRGAELPVVRGEFQRELWGTNGARIHLKQLNRACEFALTRAGKMAAVAAVKGARPRQAEVESMWREVMDCQFHDQICGCHIDAVSEGMTARFRNVLQGAREICEEAAASLCPTGAGECFTLLAFNPLAQAVASTAEFEVSPPPGWKGLAVTSAADGRALPVQLLETSSYGDGTIKWARALFRPELPGLGYGTYRVEASGVEDQTVVEAARVDGTRLSNGMLELEVDARSGLLGEARLASGEAFDLAGSNRLTIELDLGELYISGAFGATWAHRRRVDSVRAVERGPLRATLEVKGRIGRSSFVQLISLTAGSGRIDCTTRVDFRDSRHRLRCRFPTGIDGGRWVHEVPFGWLQRLAHELPAQNFVDLSGGGRGVSLINFGIPGNKLRRDEAHLTLLRSQDHAFQWDVGPGGLELGEHVFCYSLYPHKGDHVEAASALEAYKHNDPPAVFAFAGPPQEAAAAGFSLLRFDSPGVILSSLEADAGGRLLARLWEADGKGRRIEIASDAHFKGARKADLLQRDRGELEVAGSGIKIQLRPFEIANLVLEL